MHATIHLPLRALGALAAAAALAGCSSQPPSCGDEDTLARTGHLLREQLLPEKYRSIDAQVFKGVVAFEQPTPTGYDERLRKYSCEAHIVVDTSAGADPLGMPATLGRAVADLFTGHGPLLPDWQCDAASQRCRTPVRFTSQEVDGQHLVNLQGLSSAEANLIGMYASQHDPGLKAKALSSARE